LRSARGRPIAEQLPDALAHLLGRLVGERHRADRRRRDAPGEQVRDAVGDHARLAGPGPREHEQRPADVPRGLALRRVELAQIDHERA
jgi:hypothetical protein